MKNTSGDRKKKKQFIPAVGIIIVLFTAILVLCILEAVKVMPDLTKLKKEEYDTVFVSMYPIDYYEEEDYAALRGMDIVKCSNEISHSILFRVYMKWIAMAGKPVTTVYLGVDPVKTNPKDIIDLAQSYPGISFEIIYMHPQISYWTQMNDSKYGKTFSKYKELALNLMATPNVRMYLFSGQEWLICNPLNYSNQNTTNPEVSYLLMGVSDYLHPYLLTAENMEFMFADAYDVINKYREQPILYPDAHNYDIVFVGDSIFGNYTDSTSIPQVVSALSGASIYNCGVGGISAATIENTPLSANIVVDALLSGDATNLPVSDYLSSQITAFANREEKEKIMFVLNYGLNDYFNGIMIDGASPEDESTFMGAYRAIIKKIKLKYPNAQIMLCTPTFTITVEEEKKEENYLKEAMFADAVKTLAEENNGLILDNFKEMPINNDNWKEYLSDGVHLNEQGRYLFAQRLVLCIP